MDRNICFIVFAIFVCYTARDLFFKSMESTTNNSQESLDNPNNIKKEIPSMSFRSAQSRPTIKFLYCYSCGYRRAFEEYQKILEDRFPDLNVIGNNYNPSFIKSKIAQLISITKMVAIALLMCNVNPFQYFGIQTPQFWEWMRDHKLYACLMTFFLSNTLESQLMASGAFEIFYNDVPIWSKLSSGRIPSPTEFIDMIEKQQLLSNVDMYSDTMHTMSGRTL